MMCSFPLQKALDLEFAFADARGFVPVKFGMNYDAVVQSHFSTSLALSLPTTPVTLAQAGKLSDARASRYGFDVLEIT
jgi:hypothetical protein